MGKISTRIPFFIAGAAMSFSAEWLALREPIDHAARNDEIISALNVLFEGKKTIRLTDIGSGTGSTIRALTPTLKPTIAWHLVDNCLLYTSPSPRDRG